MANALQTKTDVVNELRNEIYYNQLEISRLLNTTAIPHSQVVSEIASLLKANVLNSSAIDLFEAYLPATPQQQPVAQPEGEVQSTDDLGVKQIN